MTEDKKEKRLLLSEDNLMARNFVLSIIEQELKRQAARIPESEEHLTKDQVVTDYTQVIATLKECKTHCVDIFVQFLDLVTREPETAYMFVQKIAEAALTSLVKERQNDLLT